MRGSEAARGEGIRNGVEIDLQSAEGKELSGVIEMFHILMRV